MAFFDIVSPVHNSAAAGNQKSHSHPSCMISSIVFQPNVSFSLFLTSLFSESNPGMRACRFYGQIII